MCVFVCVCVCVSRGGDGPRIRKKVCNREIIQSMVGKVIGIELCGSNLHGTHYSDTQLFGDDVISTLINA